ncbi:MAG: hypothetical protein ACHQTE_01005 [Candidatus Saccharimonadales bacterium]
MSFLVIFLAIIVVLFVVAFVTKRRFGVLGLALATGAFISTLWVGDLTPIIAQTGVVLVKPPLESVVGAALILLPATVLLLSGPTYRSGKQRFIGAALFAILATVLLLEPLGSALVINGVGKPVYEFLQSRHVAIITVCLVIAVLDLLTTKTPKLPARH